MSNASDAIDQLRFEALAERRLLENDTELTFASGQQGDGTITIADNGIGMSREEVIDHIGTIAKSGTKEFLRRSPPTTRRTRTSSASSASASMRHSSSPMA